MHPIRDIVCDTSRYNSTDFHNHPVFSHPLFQESLTQAPTTPPPLTLPPPSDDYATVRVTNLSESTRESDLEELFRPFGRLSRTYLAKDKQTGLSKGFAFISFHDQKDAEEAIKKLNGYGYDHLILKVEWSK